ncbi:hypothetical protein N431DRAFT_498255 [Stipitochalara longipes BDJ]|nr:hypothetical protein N431DRAFT_498255 [Stipitochalara longipes BDJ]
MPLVPTSKIFTSYGLCPDPVDLTPDDVSESDILDQKFNFFLDVSEAASNADDYLSEKERVVSIAAKLKLKHDVLEITGPMESLGKLVSSFGELDLHEQVSFIRKMKTNHRKHFDETKKNIDNMELGPEPLINLLKYISNAAKLFKVCVENKKLLHERLNCVLLLCGSSSHRPLATDYDFTMQKLVLMQRTWSNYGLYPSEGMRLLSLGDG